MCIHADLYTLVVNIIQLKYIIDGVSKIPVSQDQDYFPRRSAPREIVLVEGNWNLANSVNDIL